MKTILRFLLILVLLTDLSAKAAEEKSSLKIGVTVGDLGNPFFVQIAEGVKNRAYKEDKDAQITALSGDYDLSLQSSQLDNFVVLGVDLIILGAVDSEGIAPAVRRVKEAGITVIAVDVNADGGVDATVTSNNFEAGANVARYLVERINGQGNVILIDGPPTSAGFDRMAGARSIIDNYPNINILSDNQNAGGSRDGGLEVMSNLLTSFQRIDAVWAVNDPTGIGAALAIEQAGRSDEMFVVGVDGSPDAVEAFKEGKLSFAATSAQDPFTMAETATDVGINILKGNIPEEKLILTPVPLVTLDNLDSYAGWTKKASR